MKIVQKFLTNELFISLLFVVFFTYLMYPIADPTKYYRFNSDHALVLYMITEDTPPRESIYLWGQSRYGSLLFLISKFYYIAFPASTLVFVNIMTVLFTVLGFSVIVFKKKDNFVLLPLGLLFFIFVVKTVAPGNVSLYELTITTAFRPDFLFTINATILLMLFNFYYKKNWFIPALIFAILSSWINDIALPLLFIICAIFSIFDFIKNRKICAWYWLILSITAIAIVVLKYLSPNKDSVWIFASLEQISANFVFAVSKTFNVIPAYMWIVIVCLPVYFVWLYFKHDGKDEDVTFYLGHSMLLFILGAAIFVIPFFSDHIYRNNVSPRYFIHGIQLLMLAASVSIVGILVIVRKNGFLRAVHYSAFALILVLFVPIFFTYRMEMQQRSPSAFYKSGELLIESGCEAVVGEYWLSYGYTIGGLGKLKATPYDTRHTSDSNIARILAMKNICVVEKTTKDFKDQYTIRGRTLKVKNSAEKPIKLPDSRYFKHYFFK